MITPRIGLLPLYLELYDRRLPERRAKVEAFYNTIASELRKRGIEVITAPVCRVKDEFRQAVESFERTGAIAIVTLHLAYSPSLESCDALAKTSLPLIVLDTTPDHEFGPSQNPDAIMYNHGIHGVQDMCNVLLRKGKRFQILAGHWREGDLLDRATSWARSALVMNNLRSSRIGLIGKPFEGMGDFAVESEMLQQSIGVETLPCDPQLIRSLIPASEDEELLQEVVEDRERFVLDGVSEEAHLRTARACVAVRRWLEREHLSGFTMNFLAVDKASGLPTVPFLAASKAMARGLGYAGEGDVLTAALVGALGAVYPETTFTEMFCPDWKGESIFLSHMGEMNMALAAEKPRLILKPFPWTDAEEPVIAVGRLRAGRAVFVDLAPTQSCGYRLIVAEGTMLDVNGEDRMKDTIHGWFKPRVPVVDFLEKYSEVGGTHHAALVYGQRTAEIVGLGKLMGWETVLL